MISLLQVSGLLWLSSLPVSWPGVQSSTTLTLVRTSQYLGLHWCPTSHLKHMNSAGLVNIETSDLCCVHWPQEHSCPSSPSPPPAVWWRFLWLDLSGSSSSSASHTCTKRRTEKLKLCHSKVLYLQTFIYRTIQQVRQNTSSSTTAPVHRSAGLQWLTNTSENVMSESARVWEALMVLQTRERPSLPSPCTINDLATTRPWSLSIQGSKIRPSPNTLTQRSCCAASCWE